MGPTLPIGTVNKVSRNKTHTFVAIDNSFAHPTKLMQVSGHMPKFLNVKALILLLSMFAQRSHSHKESGPSYPN